MATPDSVSAYLDIVREALRFDRVLAVRVCAEVRDHFDDALREMAVSDSKANAEALAIQRFGDARAFAATFAPVAIRRLELRTAALLAIVLTGVLVVMEVRTLLLSTAYNLPSQQHGVLTTALTVDEAAFFLAMVATAAFAALLKLSKATRIASTLALPAKVACVGLAVSVFADGLAFSGVLHGKFFEGAVAITALAFLAQTSLVCGLGWWITSASRSLDYFARLSNDDVSW